MKTVAVVGGGVSGLAAAFWIQTLGREKGIPVRIHLFESSGRLGGVLQSSSKEGCLLESGPDALFTEDTGILEFLKNLGLENDLIGTNPDFRKSFILFNDRLVPVPEGFYLLAPSRILPLACTPLFSWRGKLRILCDLFISRKENPGDESLSSFVLRRLGREALERMAQPMVSGIYNSDPEDLSLEATFPRFLEWEQTYGSVIRGLINRKHSVKNANNSRGPRYGLFVTLKNGMETMVERIRDSLPSENIHLNSEIKKMVFSPGMEKKFKLDSENKTFEADAVCLALPAFKSSDLLKEINKELSDSLGEIPHRTGATVNLVYRDEDVSAPLDGFGFVVPQIEKRNITGCTYSSVKFPGRAPEGKVLLRAFIGGKISDDLMNKEEIDLIRTAKNDLKEILGINSEPLSVQVSRHFKALPQYRVGHIQTVKRIMELAQTLPGLALAGNAYIKPGIPGCVQSARNAAENILHYIQGQNDRLS